MEQTARGHSRADQEEARRKIKTEATEKDQRSMGQQGGERSSKIKQKTDERARRHRKREGERRSRHRRRGQRAGGCALEVAAATERDLRSPTSTARARGEAPRRPGHGGPGGGQPATARACPTSPARQGLDPQQDHHACVCRDGGERREPLRCPSETGGWHPALASVLRRRRRQRDPGAKRPPRQRVRVRTHYPGRPAPGLATTPGGHAGQPRGAGIRVASGHLGGRRGATVGHWPGDGGHRAA